MKKLSVIVSVLLAVVLAFGLVGCSSYGTLKKAFEKAGYEEVTELESVAETIKEEAKKNDIVVTLHGIKKVKGLTSDLVLIVEFKATEDMKKFYENSETVKGIVKDVAKNEDVKEWQKAMENAGYAKGNCLVFSINPLNMNEVTSIVKGA